VEHLRCRTGITGSQATARPRQAIQFVHLSYPYIDAPTPTLFENRPSYRLLGVQWLGTGDGRMTFGLANYFDKLDISEAVGHESAMVRLQLSASKHEQRSMTWEDLPLRALIGDPFDCKRRAIIPAITTLLLRRRRSLGTASFLLHWRDPAKVATASGLYDVIPAGEFQPSSMAPWDQLNDFDIWRNIVRELSEELLGTPEHDGSQSVPIDYDGWPFYRALSRCSAKRSALCLLPWGRARCSYPSGNYSHGPYRRRYRVLRSICRRCPDKH
jgi:hypothetical protein